MFAGVLLRGDESYSLTLSALSVSKNQATAPLAVEGVQIDIRFSKTNRGDKLDNRLLGNHCQIHMDAQLHMGLHVWGRMEAPFVWRDIKSGRWYAIPRAAHDLNVR